MHPAAGYARRILSPTRNGRCFFVLHNKLFCSIYSLFILYFLPILFVQNPPQLERSHARQLEIVERTMSARYQAQGSAPAPAAAVPGSWGPQPPTLIHKELENIDLETLVKDKSLQLHHFQAETTILKVFSPLLLSKTPVEGDPQTRITGTDSIVAEGGTGLHLQTLATWLKQAKGS